MEIHWVGLSELDDAERTHVEARLDGLAKGHKDLIDLRITGHQSRHHHHGGQEVRITCQARGRNIVASSARPEMGFALNGAVDVFEREVHRLRDKRKNRSRGRVTKEGLDRLSEADGVPAEVEPGGEAP